jgi:sugar-specific transcriptional regulator TrmB
LTEETLKTTLEKFGLTKQEAEVYLFLAKRWALKTGQISKQMKKNKGQTYRLLTSLQKKGLVETTLEFPTRYVAVPLEKVLDSFIHSKREEVASIEREKDGILEDWNNISKIALQSQLERFTVLEGTKKIVHKISQMIKETNNQLSAILTVADLARGEQFGIFDLTQTNKIQSKQKLCVLTEVSQKNLKALRLLQNKLNSRIKLRARQTGLCLTTLPRLVIRDNKELMFFITKNDQETCLCTNCKSLIQAFSNVFDNMWQNSTDIKEGIDEIETGKLPPSVTLIKDSAVAKRKYEKVLASAYEEITILTSSKGIVKYSEEIVKLKKLNDRNVTIRIMAPITEKNLEASQKLLSVGTVKHVPLSYLETTIIDKKHLFQFKQPPSESGIDNELSFFENLFYTNDEKYIEKTLHMFSNIWEKACIPSPATVESIIFPKGASSDADSSSSAMRNFRKILTFEIEEDNKKGRLTETEVLNKILKATTSKAEVTKDKSMLFASTGQAVIHPPKYFNLPDIMLHAWHVDNHSSPGGNDSLVIHMWQNSLSNSGFIPSAIISNEPCGTKVLSNIFTGTPAEKNTQVLKKDEFQVRVHGNTLFAIWTIPLVIKAPNYVLPPCCLLLEGVGKVKTGRLAFLYRNGFRNKIEFNAFEALVTFYHPSSQYEGPGTDGIFFRDYVGETYVPEKNVN